MNAAISDLFFNYEPATQAYSEKGEDGLYTEARTFSALLGWCGVAYPPSAEELVKDWIERL